MSKGFGEIYMYVSFYQTVPKLQTQFANVNTVVNGRIIHDGPWFNVSKVWDLANIVKETRKAHFRFKPYFLPNLLTILINTNVKTF